MRILSIHVDESGDFGSYNAKFAPYYIFSLVFHEQENDISEEIKVLNRELKTLGFSNHVFHMGPLIRKEEAYCNLLPNERHAIFTKFFFFTKKAPISYKIFTIARKEYPEADSLKARINLLLSRFLDQYLNYFTSFERVVLYYDNGQSQLAHELMDVFERKITNFYRKPDARPNKYILLQVADMLCTLQLLEIKAERNELTRSELCVFHSARELKKDFIKKIKDKEFILANAINCRL